MKTLLLGILIFSVHTTIAQHTIRGKIIDGKTKEPLAFVNIKINDNPRMGAVSDIDGNFKYESQTKIETLLLSYVGYERKIIQLDTVKNARQLTIPLNQISLALGSVTIAAGENPADRIIRQVAANRRINNPENVTSFTYNSHNKIIADIVVNDTTSKGDSLQNRIRRSLRGGYLFITETTTERKFLSGRSQETILSTRTSGIKEFALPFSATDFQPFSFYGDHFQIMDVKYLSPISRGSTNYYFFNIEDTVFQNQDTVFVISFRPKRGKNIDGLKGVLQINTNKYAVQNVIAEPAEPGLLNMKIQQKYVFLNDTQWFPEQLNFEISFGLSGSPGSSVEAAPGNPPKTQSLVINGRTYIDNVELFPDLHRKNFSIDQVVLDAMAKYQDSLFWSERRIVPLDTMEIATYRFIDSIGEVANLDRFMTFYEKFLQGKIPIKCFDLDLSKTIVINEFENFRLGLGVHTNERLSKHVSVGGFFGYGTRDKLWKYGGEGIWTINQKHEIDLRLSYQNTIRETGCNTLFARHFDLFDFRSYMASQMDQIEEKAVNFAFRLFRYAKFNVGLNQVHVKPLYDYVFQNDFTNYDYTELNVGVRYAFGERFIRTSGKRLSLGTKFPIFHVNYSRGINGFLDGDFDFNKVEFRVDKSFTWKILGESKIRVDAGLVDRPLPYGLLFTGEGNVDKKLPVFSPNYFQTMDKYEFLSDQYTNVFLSHNFGSLFLRIRKFQPHFALHHNMGWGRLSHLEYQQNIEFKTKDKGFYESGLQINNILKLKYFGMMYIGFGAGAYYRYGDYAFDKPMDNFKFKLSLTLSTK
ncbi:MAG: DUF5686 and carboxypeptidase regulatory-like domain-containing protein [Bacteroidales bacterium]|nr:DUF5686 and carboxypeptidase regulatory-like domain-containing protein [Bacteroidales bacterium]